MPFSHFPSITRRTNQLVSRELDDLKVKKASVGNFARKVSQSRPFVLFFTAIGSAFRQRYAFPKTIHDEIAGSSSGRGRILYVHVHVYYFQVYYERHAESMWAYPRNYDEWIVDCGLYLQNCHDFSVILVSNDANVVMKCLSHYGIFLVYCILSKN